MAKYCKLFGNANSVLSLGFLDVVDGAGDTESLGKLIISRNIQEIDSNVFTISQIRIIDCKFNSPNIFNLKVIWHSIVVKQLCRELFSVTDVSVVIEPFLEATMSSKIEDMDILLVVNVYLFDLPPVDIALVHRSKDTLD